ncbi:MAG: sigma-70 family RNA polymerase sigma factor [Kofleriaceae bacterium]
MTFSAAALEVLADVRIRWPHGPEPEATFAAYLAARVSPNPRIDDLYLAWWCGSGDPAAIVAFDARYDNELRIATARFHDLAADELLQQLHIKLFVGSAETPPKIGEYSGKGALGAWLRVTALRTFVDIARSTRSHRYEQELDEVELIGSSDPERSSINAAVTAAVKKAFAEAVAGLTSRQRVFLRHAYVDRHTLDQIATHYAMHRTTIARTLASARTQLMTQTRLAVARELGIGDGELSTMIRELDSRLELSLSRVLDKPSEDSI